MKTHHVAGVAAIAFGSLTLISGGSALFGAVDMGAVVPFVLWFNFLAGCAYVIGGLLLIIGHRLALPVALTILIATATVFAVFGWRVFAGDAFEMRTVGAMTLRTFFWAAMVWVAMKARGRKSRL
ncbi:hypothetical protein CCR83_08730 [Rhodobacter veldkampii DSM 11550]|uniref:hypothetical protein n=1 Tax=Phaeovulum veldkampii TaxID=33049 RepID=UPI00105DE920|nr:hypothetical protein [Phaeovulum veldkampii]MBK5946510.1 hypothetical protein [Phaeovulum veldkampii DSM 11550]TDQ53201.1 hypothetical protein EV658_14511 [Phaeovulum veldkampii DSM 11550]